MATFLKFLCFTAFNVLFISAITYDCTTNTTVYLSINQLAFFKTTKYPNLLSPKKYSSCNFTFELGEKNYTNYRQHTVIIKTGTNMGDWGSFLLYPILTNYSTFMFRENNTWFEVAEMGFILFEEWNDGCLLESISRNKPYMFSDDKEYLFVFSSFKTGTDFFYRKNACRWRFSAPDGYGFKIDIYYFNISSTTKFFIQNSTDILVNERNAQIHHPYYNSDKWIQISLSKTSEILNINDDEWVEFGAAISIIKSEKQKTANKNCWTKRHKNIITWENFPDNFSGHYGNNVRCTFNLLIFPNTEVFVSGYLFLEEGVDVVRYYTEDNNTEVLLDVDWDGDVDSDNGLLILLPHYNRSIKRLFWEFTSDGSVQSTGFSLNFHTQVCNCTTNEILCDDFTEYTIMDNTDYYCSNLYCKFILPSCPTDTMLVALYFDGEDYDKYGIFKIVSNGVTVLNVNNDLIGSLSVFLSSSSENIFEVTTFPLPVYKTMSFTVAPVRIPPIDFYITLSSSSPIKIINTAPYILASVQISEEMISQNLSILIYAVDTGYDAIQLFNNKSLTFTLENFNCFGINRSQTCELNLSHFIIYSSVDSISTFVALKISQKNEGCLFQKDLYMASDQFIPIVGIADKFEDCTIYVISQFSTYYRMENLWTSSSDKNVKVYSGINKEKLFFEFTSHTVKKFNNLILFSRIYQFVIPKGTALFISLRQLYNGYTILYPSPIVISASYPSLLATPDYGNAKIWEFRPRNTFISFNVNETPLKFTVIDCLILPKDNFIFITDDKNYFISGIGDTFVFQNQIVKLNYTYSLSSEAKNGLLFLIETLKHTPN